jgi:WD40 repeat protein
MQLNGHSGPVNAVAFDPASKTLASAGDDGTVRIWDLSTGSEMHVLRGHFMNLPSDQQLKKLGSAKHVFALAFSPDGKTLASGAVSDSVKVWDLASGSVRTTLPVPDEATALVCSLSFSRDGKTLAAAVNRGRHPRLRWICQVFQWQLATGNELGQPIEAGPLPLPVVAFTPDGQTIALTNRNRVALLDPSTGKERAGLRTADVSGAISLAVSGDGTTLASVEIGATAPGTNFVYHQVVVWNMATGNELFTIPRQREGIATVALSPNGRLLAFGSSDGTVKVWSTTTAMQHSTFQGDTGPVRSVAISPDGKLLAAAGKSGTIHLWNLE